MLIKIKHKHCFEIDTTTLNCYLFCCRSNTLHVLKKFWHQH